LKSKKKLLANQEIKWGLIICVSYLVWTLSWFIYSHLILGEFSNPFVPTINISAEVLAPSFEHIFGTDIYGRSLFQLVSMGLLYSIIVSILVCTISAVIGLFVGYAIAVGGPVFSKFCDLITNLIFVFPTILIAIIFLSISERSSMALIMVLVFTSWPGYARIVRGEVKRVLGIFYVEGDRAIGYGQFRLLRKSILPAILPQLLIHIVLGLSGAIMSEATLGFLGLGGSEYSWGVLLGISKSVLLEAPHMVIILSLLIAVLIIGLNLLGDGLRDYLDPKSDIKRK
jgi:peptide/nickel transport system permease protein